MYTEHTLRAAELQKCLQNKSRDKNHNVIVLIAQRDKEREKELDAFTQRIQYYYITIYHKSANVNLSKN